MIIFKKKKRKKTRLSIIINGIYQLINDNDKLLINNDFPFFVIFMVYF